MQAVQHRDDSAGGLIPVREEDAGMRSLHLPDCCQRFGCLP